jgi:hypothetical protein
MIANWRKRVGAGGGKFYGQAKKQGEATKVPSPQPSPEVSPEVRGSMFGVFGAGILCHELSLCDLEERRKSKSADFAVR